jgi:hypothetical protein
VSELCVLKFNDRTAMACVAAAEGLAGWTIQLVDSNRMRPAS